MNNFYYSYFNVSTGFSLAAFNVYALTETMVIIITINTGIMNNHKENVIFEEKLFNQ